MAEKKDWAAEDARAKENWLKEHLPYEVMMMRHCLRRLKQTPRPWYLDWNSFLSGFAVSAGNVAAFLTNTDGQGNFKASDFVNGFKSRKANDVKKPFELMEPYVFHLGKFRPTDDDKANKFSLNDAVKISNWIEEQLGDFIGRLSEEDKKLWDEEGSVPPEPPKGSTVTLKNIEPQTSSSYSTSVFLRGETGYREQKGETTFFVFDTDKNVKK